MNLKKYRNNKKLTQEKIANLINVAPSTYRGYESNSNEPTIATLIKLSKIFEISLDELCENPFNKKIELQPYQNEIYKELPKLNETQCGAIMSMIKAFNIPTTEEDLLNARLIKKYGDK